MGPHAEIEERTIAELQQLMGEGELTAQSLLSLYLDRIEQLDRQGPELRSIIELNPDAMSIAEELDRERSERGPRGPLHGVPMLLKDNIDTADKMTTTAGSLALEGSHPLQDAFVTQRLRAAGAIIVGKANLSEWANFRSSHSSSGWSGRGGQGKNPFVLDRSPCGSSSGSGQSVSANLIAAAIGSETDGSIVCPSHSNGIVGIKPTVGLVSRAGIIPISHSQDTAGPMTRTVADAAAVLSAIAGVDPRDPMTAASAGKSFADYTQFLDKDGLRGARIGIVREVYSGYSRETDAIVEESIQVLRDLGAVIVDPANIPTAAEMKSSDAQFQVMLYEIKADLNAYFATLGPNAPLRTLEDLIAFNDKHADREMKYFGQDALLKAQEKGPLTEQAYLDALATSRSLSRERGIDAVMNQHNLDALIAATGAPSWPIDLVNGDHYVGSSSTPAAMAGYPLISVPAGYVFGLPVGLTFMGRAYSEPTLIRLAYAFEQATNVRRAPSFLPTLPTE
ncbi:MAG TPA: amidase [Nitrolancea sp.]|nr:amidase [Nitrolancea sp.]